MPNEAQGNTFYVPQRIHIQLPATQENPAGGVITLNEGWHEDVDDESVLNHPIVQRLRGQSKGEASRMDEMAEMNRRAANGEASPREQSELAQKHAKAAQDERQEEIDEWNERATEAADRGVVFDEQHPDPEVARAIALTAQPAHVFSAASFAQRPQALKEAKETREALEPTDTVTKREGDRGAAGNTSNQGERKVPAQAPAKKE